MRCPTIKCLVSELKIEKEDAIKIRKLAKAVENKAAFENLIDSQHAFTHFKAAHRADDPYDSSRSRRELMMHAINIVLRTFGIEIIGNDSENYRYEYCNNGDQYAPTIFFDKKEDRLLIGSWNDFARR